MIVVPPMVPVASSPPATTTWNPADKSAFVTLSNGNLSATQSSSGEHSVRSTTSKSTGKSYFEFSVPLILLDFGVGLATISAGLDAFLADDTNAWCWYNTVPGHIYFNNAVAYPGTFSLGNGDTGAIAIDFDAKLFWNRQYSIISATWSDWNFSGSTANPATGAGGNSFAAIAGGPYFAATNPRSTTNVVTANFGNGLIGPIPAGFSAWG